MNELARPFPKPPAKVAVYYEVLGPDLTVDFILAFGGAPIFISESPKGRSSHEKLVGFEMAKALGERLNPGPNRVPLATKWLATVMAWQGHSIADIARRLRVADVTVRGWLKAAG